MPHSVYFLHRRPRGRPEAVYHVGVTGNPDARKADHYTRVPGARFEVVWSGMTKKAAYAWESAMALQSTATTGLGSPAAVCGAGIRSGASAEPITDGPVFLGD